VCGRLKASDLTARHVQTALADLSGSLSMRSLRLIHQIIERAIRHAAGGADQAFLANVRWNWPWLVVPPLWRCALAAGWPGT
jgi:hypothetical protein